MKCFHRSTLFAMLLGCGIAIAMFRPADAQQWSFSELANRLSQEKAKVVTYRLYIHQTPIKGTRFDKLTWIHEFSEIGNHEVVARIDRNESGAIQSWRLSGHTEDLEIYGSNPNRKIYHSKVPEGEKVQLQTFLDWRIVGFSFCGDIGDRFETVATNISGWDSPKSQAEFRNTAEGLLVNDRNGCQIEAEIKDGIRIKTLKQGYEPTGDRRDPQYVKWTVEYKKAFNLMLPSKATLICGDNTVEYEFSWMMVNEPIETGLPTVKRFADDLPIDKSQP
jgi:hypothetical protein